jgi:hypothetical protein
MGGVERVENEVKLLAIEKESVGGESVNSMIRPPPDMSPRAVRNVRSVGGELVSPRCLKRGQTSPGETGINLAAYSHIQIYCGQTYCRPTAISLITIDGDEKDTLGKRSLFPTGLSLPYHNRFRIP